MMRSEHSPEECEVTAGEIAVLDAVPIAPNPV
jgi:hypothetical protein